MPNRIVNSEDRPILVGPPGGAVVLVQATGQHPFIRLRTGDLAWVTGDGVEGAVALGFLAYVVAPTPMATSVLAPAPVTAAPASVAAAQPKGPMGLRERPPVLGPQPEPAGDVYDRMTHDDLYGLAQEHQIVGRSKMSNPELVAAVRLAENQGG